MRSIYQGGWSWLKFTIVVSVNTRYHWRLGARPGNRFRVGACAWCVCLVDLGWLRLSLFPFGRGRLSVFPSEEVPLPPNLLSSFSWRVRHFQSIHVSCFTCLKLRQIWNCGRFSLLFLPLRYGETAQGRAGSTGSAAWQISADTQMERLQKRSCNNNKVPVQGHGRIHLGPETFHAGTMGT